MKALVTLSLAISIAVSASGCGGGSSSSAAAMNGGGPAPLPVSTIYAVDTSDQLYTFQSNAPGSFTLIAPISGLQSGESIIGITFSPEGILFGLSDQGVLYRINTTSGSTLNVSSGSVSLNGSNFGFSFNPISYEIRITSDAGSNFLMNPGNGTVAESDPKLVYAAGDANASRTPHLVTSSESCGCGGVTPTTYGIDDQTGNLVTVGNVNANPLGAESSQVFTVGSLGVAVSGYVTLSLLTDSQTAYSTVSSNSGTSLYRINLTSGQATLVGAASVPNPIRSAVLLPTSN